MNDERARVWLPVSLLQLKHRLQPRHQQLKHQPLRYKQLKHRLLRNRPRHPSRLAVL